MNSRNPHRLGWWLLALLLAPFAHAQWQTQQITLQPGWNSVFLEVDPEPRDCAAAFAGVPVESVWMFNGRFGESQFARQPSELTPRSADWLVYLPTNSQPRLESTLFSILGGRPYLIKLAGIAPAIWTLTGKPRPALQRFAPRAFSFVGFPLNGQTPVSVQNFFSGSPALNNQAVYDLNAAGEWVLVTDRSRPLRRGRGYWVFATEAVDYAGPLDVRPEGGVRQVAFGSGGTSTRLRIANNSAARRTITLRPLNSATPPAGELANAGPVVLGYLPPGGTDFLPFTGPITLDLAARQNGELRIEIRRSLMAAPPVNPSAQYQSLIEVDDGAGARITVPVTSDLPGPTGAAELGQAAARGPNLKSGRPARFKGIAPRSRFAGLWSGYVVANNVSDPRSAQPGSPVPTPSEFSFRVLMHVDTRGEARLLREALVMFKPGVLEPSELTDGQGRPFNQVAEPGEYVIITDNSLLSLRNSQGQLLYRGSTLRDDINVGRRMSSVNFPFDQPLPLAGVFGTNGAVLTATHTMDFDHPWHPFRHLYHPDHDNKTAEFQAAPRGNESWDITRRFRFEFLQNDPDAAAPPQAGLGQDQVVGRYAETIVGLHKTDIIIGGTFRLTRLLNIAELNDGR
jgi:hypothetical protein